MKAIILAAGEGTRLRPLTKGIPKCMVQIAGKPIIEWQLELFKKSNIKVIIVTGHKREKIRYKNVKYMHNSKYNQTNMVETLFCAKSELTEPTIISYGDIIFEEKILKKIIQSEFDSSVIIDRKWKEYWELRFDDPLSDAESLKTNDGGYITDIGRKPKETNEIQGQYIGLMKFQNKGLEDLKKTYEQMKDDSRNNRNQINGIEFEKLYMTDLLRGMIKNGSKIKAVPTNNGWLEIDTIDDYNTYTKMINDGTIRKFIRIGQ